MITRTEIDDRADRFGVPTEQIERDHLVSRMLVAATADEARAWQTHRPSLLSCSDGWGAEAYDVVADPADLPAGVLQRCEPFDMKVRATEVTGLLRAAYYAPRTPRGLTPEHLVIRPHPGTRWVGGE